MFCLLCWIDLRALEKGSQFLKRDPSRQTDFLLIFVYPGIEEEGLLLKDTVQTPAVENPATEELQAELSSPELPEDVTLPEPPVEIEASGSGTGDLENLLRPASEDEMTTDYVAVGADAISEADTKEVGEEPTAADAVILEEDRPTEVVVNEAEIAEELEISTIASKTTEEEGLPVLVPPTEAVDVASEAETGLLPFGEDSVEGTAEDSYLTDVPLADEVANPENAAINVVFSNPEKSENGEDSVFEDGGMEEATESEGHKVTEDPEISEAPAVEKEAPEAPQISTEDLTEDEIFLANNDEPKPPVTASLSPAQPTTLSPERESPSTHIADVKPASEEKPDTIIPSLVEVKQKN